MARVLIGYDGLREKGITLSPRQLHRKVLAGTFPAPVMIGECRKTWVEAEVDEWIEDRKAERPEPRAA